MSPRFVRLQGTYDTVLPCRDYFAPFIAFALRTFTDQLVKRSMCTVGFEIHHSFLISRNLFFVTTLLDVGVPWCVLRAMPYQFAGVE